MCNGEREAVAPVRIGIGRVDEIAEQHAAQGNDGGQTIKAVTQKSQESLNSQFLAFVYRSCRQA